MKHVSLSAIAASLLMVLALSACQGSPSDKDLTVKCFNGRFMGMQETPRKAQVNMLLPHCQNFYIKK